MGAPITAPPFAFVLPVAGGGRRVDGRWGGNHRERRAAAPHVDTRHRGDRMGSGCVGAVSAVTIVTRRAWHRSCLRMRSLRDVPDGVWERAASAGNLLLTIDLSAGRTRLQSFVLLPAANPTVIFRTVAEGGVIFSTVDEVYYGLNAVGSRVWELLPPATETMDELVTKLAADYPEVAPDIIRADITELLRDLESHGLVQARPAAAAGVNAAARASVV